MTEVTRNSAMVREPTTIHTTTATTADESSSSTTHLASPTSESQQDSIMPDLSETKLHNSRPNNRTPAGELRHKHTGHSSGDEGTHDEEDKHDGNDEVGKHALFITGF